MSLYCIAPSKFHLLIDVTQIYVGAGGWVYFTSDTPVAGAKREDKYQATELVKHEMLRDRQLPGTIAPFIDLDEIKEWIARQVQRKNISAALASDQLDAFRPYEAAV